MYSVYGRRKGEWRGRLREDGWEGEGGEEGEKRYVPELTPWTGLGGGGKLFSHSFAASCCFSSRWNCMHAGREGGREGR